MLGREEKSTILLAVDLADGGILWKRKVDGRVLRGQSGLLMVSGRGGRSCYSMKKGKSKSCPSKPDRRGRNVRWDSLPLLRQRLSVC